MNTTTESVNRELCESGNDHIQQVKARMNWWVNLLTVAAQRQGDTRAYLAGWLTVWEGNDGWSWLVLLVDDEHNDQNIKCIRRVILSKTEGHWKCRFECGSNHMGDDLSDADTCFVDDHFQGFIDGMMTVMPNLRDVIRPYEEAAKRSTRSAGLG